MGFDVGAVIANLFFSYVGHEIRHEELTKDPGGRKRDQAWLLETIEGVWAHFETEFRGLWQAELRDQSYAPSQDAFLRRLFEESLGFAGCKMIRRIVGLAHVADLEKIDDPERRVHAERLGLEVGRRLIVGRTEFRNISEVWQVVDGLSDLRGTA